jgi:hypothetical protein
MTKREAAIVSAYTGVLLGDFDELHKYIEEIMGGDVFTHEPGNREKWGEIKARSKPDLISLEVL